MDAFGAGRLTRTLDALHSVVYFLPEADAKFGELGLDSRTHYFAGRSAPIRRMSLLRRSITSTRGLVVRAIPAACELASPVAVTRVESIRNSDGRPLHAGHAELPWPDSPLAALWHAIRSLREYRGDGHIIALVANGLSGLEALITCAATGIGFSADYARRLRGWSHDEWNPAAEGLISRAFCVVGA